MKLPLDKLPSFSDERLVNVVLYRQQYGYPFDYVEACKDELRKRGFSNDDIAQLVNRSELDTYTPLRFSLRRRLEVATRVVRWAPVIAAVLFAALFLWTDVWTSGVRRAVGGAAVLSLCMGFLAYAQRIVLKGNLARLDAPPDE